MYEIVMRNIFDIFVVLILKQEIYLLVFVDVIYLIGCCDFLFLIVKVVFVIGVDGVMVEVYFDFFVVFLDFVQQMDIFEFEKWLNELKLMMKVKV